MRRRGRWLLGTAVMVIAIAVLVMVFSDSEKEAVTGRFQPTLTPTPGLATANLEILQPLVEWRSVDTQSWRDAVSVVTIVEGDFLQAAPQGEAELYFMEDTLIHLMSDTQMQILTLRHSESLDAASEINVRLSIWRGQQQHIVGAGLYSVETPALQ
ncbi:MAG TPA: hypothetical protein VJZ27_17980, partial [Aggregatilineales bacterium]|nr:hypothetical protein [Aggregatilineales bacterium]